MSLELRAGPPVSGEIARAPDASRIAVSLNEPGGQTSRWRIRLDAELQDGTRGTVGFLTTRTLASSGNVAARIIGTACCPGAIAWHAVAEQIDTAGAGATGTLGASPSPGPARRAELYPNRPHALAVTYAIVAGVDGAAAVPAAARVRAISALVALGAAADGTIAIPGSDTLTVPIGTACTVQPELDLIGPLTITFTGTAAYEIETEA